MPQSQEVRRGISERIREFQLLTIAHPLLAAAKDKLLAAINEAPPGSIVMVFGPTGVGKTTLRMKVEQMLAEQSRQAMETDPGRLPYVSVEAPAPDNGNFSWRDHYRRLLVELSEPMLEHKTKPNWIHLAQDLRGQNILGSRAPAGELRHAVELAILNRRPAAVLVDEAQHLTRIVSGRKLVDQLDVIKSLANCTRTVHVLLGTYELLALRNLSGQLGRRCVDIHFRRYSAESPADVHTFKNALLTFQRHFPLAEQTDLLPLWDLFYERSVGCIGIMKDWLQRALTAALKEGCTGVTRRHLEGTALSASQCEQIVIEAHEGEARLASADHPRSQLRTLLGLSVSAPAQAGALAKFVPSAERKPGRVGQRNPIRDRVGQAAVSAGMVCNGV
jgi:energy-coupling factor transporter ATP-binding protein EcfA2